MSYSPIVRIVLRYLVGAWIMGSSQLGEQLASDPDIVDIISMGLAFLGALVGGFVEWLYRRAKKTGGAT